MSRTTRTVARNQRAFTLIEVVVALALVALVAVVLFESLRFGQHGYERVVRRGAESWEVLATQRLIRSILESAYPQEANLAGSTPYGLEARADRIAVTAAAPLAVGGAGLYRYEIAIRPAGSGDHELVIQWRPDYAEAVGASDVNATEEVLMEGVRTVEWSFLEAGAGDGSAAPMWRTEWQGRRDLPRLIRLHVTFAAGDRRRWPDLLVAPRITADANCAFDVVAQRCRITA